MFIVNKDEYRNLQEQVLDNKNKIRAHWEVDRVIAEFGIRVIGRVDTAADILEQPVPEGGYQFGDAYAVGPEDTSYDYYIYTRPFAGETEAKWFNIGKLSLQGPQGPKGDKGDRGLMGTANHLFVIDYAGPPLITSETAAEHPYYLALNEGDWSIDINGNIYQYLPMSGGWTAMGVNLKGPIGKTGPMGQTGPRGYTGSVGPKGDTGERGLGLVILGNDASLPLPAPASVRRDGAYLVLVNGEKHLYAITGLGTAADPLAWEDLGVYSLTSSGGGGQLYLHSIRLQTSNDYGYADVYINVYNTDPTPYGAVTDLPHQTYVAGGECSQEMDYGPVNRIQIEDWGYNAYFYATGSGYATNASLDDTDTTITDTVSQL